MKRILTFSRRAEQEKRPTKLATIVKDVLTFLRASFPATINIHLNTAAQFGLTLVDSVQIQQVVMNLCTNAAYALRQTGGHFPFMSMGTTSPPLKPLRTPR